MKKLILLGSSILLSMLLMSCGAENNSSKEANNSTSTEISNEASNSNSSKEKSEEQNTDDKPLTKVTLALDWVPNTNHTGLYVAKENGYLKDEGIDLDIVQPADDSSAAIVGANKANFGIYFQPNMVKRLDKETPITAVAAICQHNTGGIMSLASSDIKSPKALTDKKYSTWEDPVDDACIKYLVNNDGGNWDKVIKVPGESTDATTALKMKLFDAIFVYYGWDFIHSKTMKVPCNFFYLTDYDKTFDYYTPVIIANNDFLKNEKDVAIRTLRAIKKGYEFAAENPDKAADILIKNAPETDPELVKESQKYLSTKYIDDAKAWGIIDPSRWNAFYKWVYEQGLSKTDLQNKGFSNEYLQ